LYRDRALPCCALFPYTTLFRSIHEVECTSCGRRTPTPEVLARLDEESDPHCPVCGGIQKTATISFGQMLDPAVLEAAAATAAGRSEEHTSELQSRENLVCRLLP